MPGLGDSWGTREEMLHPRDSHGRFRTKWKMAAGLVDRIQAFLAAFSPRQFQSDNQSAQYLQNKAKPARFSSGGGYHRLHVDYDEANEALRRGEMDPETRKFVKQMDDSSITTTDDLIVTRTVDPEAFGLNAQNAGAEDGGMEDFTGKLIADRGYSAANVGTPMGMGPGRVQMTVAVPKGTKMIIPSRSQTDRGVFLDRDQPYRITKVTPDGRGGFYVMAIAEPHKGNTTPPIEARPARGVGLTPQQRAERLGAPSQQKSTAPPNVGAGAPVTQQMVDDQNRATPQVPTAGGPPPRDGEPIHAESIGGGGPAPTAGTAEVAQAPAQATPAAPSATPVTQPNAPEVTPAAPGGVAPDADLDKVRQRTAARKRFRAMAKSVPVAQSMQEMADLDRKGASDKVKAQHIRGIISDPSMEELSKEDRDELSQKLEAAASDFDRGKPNQGKAKLAQIARGAGLVSQHRAGDTVDFDATTMDPVADTVPEGPVKVLSPPIVHIDPDTGKETVVSKGLVGSPDEGAPSVPGPPSDGGGGGAAPEAPSAPVVAPPVPAPIKRTAPVKKAITPGVPTGERGQARMQARRALEADGVEKPTQQQIDDFVKQSRGGFGPTATAKKVAAAKKASAPEAPVPAKAAPAAKKAPAKKAAPKSGMDILAEQEAHKLEVARKKGERERKQKDREDAAKAKKADAAQAKEERAKAREAAKAERAAAPKKAPAKKAVPEKELTEEQKRQAEVQARADEAGLPTTVADLRARAKEEGIRGFSTMRKEQLQRALLGEEVPKAEKLGVVSPEKMVGHLKRVETHNDALDLLKDHTLADLKPLATEAGVEIPKRPTKDKLKNAILQAVRGDQGTDFEPVDPKDAISLRDNLTIPDGPEGDMMRRGLAEVDDTSPQSLLDESERLESHATQLRQKGDRSNANLYQELADRMGARAQQISGMEVQPKKTPVKRAAKKAVPKKRTEAEVRALIGPVLTDELLAKAGDHERQRKDAAKLMEAIAAGAPDSAIGKQAKKAAAELKAPAKKATPKVSVEDRVATRLMERIEEVNPKAAKEIRADMTPADRAEVDAAAARVRAERVAKATTPPAPARAARVAKALAGPEGAAPPSMEGRVRANGRIPAGKLAKGDRIYVEQNGDGGWRPTTRKTGTKQITVDRTERVATEHGFHRSTNRIAVIGHDDDGNEIRVDRLGSTPGGSRGFPGHQTFLTAPAPGAAPAKAAKKAVPSAPEAPAPAKVAKKAVPRVKESPADALTRFRAATTREEAHAALEGKSGTELRAMAKEGGISLGSSRTVAEMRDAMVEGTVGGTLDFKAIQGDATLPGGPSNAPLDRMTQKELVAQAAKENVTTVRPSWTKDRIKKEILDQRGLRESVSDQPSVKTEGGGIQTKQALPSPAEARAAQARVDVGRVHDRLTDSDNPPSREEAAALVQPLSKAQLQELATRISLPGAKSKNMTDLRLDIVEGTAGRRLDSIATRGLLGTRPDQGAERDLRARQAGNRRVPEGSVEGTRAQRPVQNAGRAEGFNDAWDKAGIKTTDASVQEVRGDVATGKLSPEEGVRRLETDIKFNEDDISEMDAQLRSPMDIEERRNLRLRKEALEDAVDEQKKASKFLRDHFKSETITPKEVETALPADISEKLRHADLDELKEEARAQGIKAEGDTPEEVATSIIRDMAGKRLAAKKAAPAKKAAKAAPKIDPADPGKPDVRAIGSGLDWNDDDAGILAGVQRDLDGPTPGRAAMNLEKKIKAREDILAVQGEVDEDLLDDATKADLDRQATAIHASNQRFRELATRLRGARATKKAAPAKAAKAAPTPPDEAAKLRARIQNDAIERFEGAKSKTAARGALSKLTAPELREIADKYGIPRGSKAQMTEALVARQVNPGASAALDPAKLSTKATIPNRGEGHGGPNGVGFHPDGPVGESLRRMGDERRMEVDGDSLENLVGRWATDSVEGRITTEEMLDRLKAVRDRTLQGSRTRGLLDDMIKEIDAPARAPLSLPDSSPEPIRRLMEEFSRNPITRGRDMGGRRGQESFMDRLREAAARVDERAQGGGNLWSSWERELHGLHNKFHESYGAEGKFEMDRAVQKALKDMDALRDAERKARARAAMEGGTTPRAAPFAVSPVSLAPRLQTQPQASGHRFVRPATLVRSHEPSGSRPEPSLVAT